MSEYAGSPADSEAAAPVAAASDAATEAVVAAAESERVSIATEEELKFAPGADQPVPDLSGLAYEAGGDSMQLDAVYFDSPDFRLSRAKLTLRRRTGGTDAGWHLKLPAGSARTEMHVDLSDGDETRVPAELLAVVREEVGQVPLIPVALLSTARTTTLLAERAGGPAVAALSDDHVTAVRFARPGVAAARSEWRELEVELIEAGTGQVLLDGIAEIFAAAGIEPAAAPSKLARALGTAPELAAQRTLDRKSPLVQTVLAAMAEHIGVLQHREQDVAVDAPDAVHKARVASRRLRSILKTFAPLFDANSVIRLREELKWFATRLGYARDAEVQLERLPRLLDDLPAEAITEGVAEQMTQMLTAHHRTSVANVKRTLSTVRYRTLLASLQHWLEDPPFNPGWDASARTGKAYRPMLDATIAKVRRQHRKVRATSGAEQLVHRHEVRKKAKVVRYVCEALSPALGTPAAEAAEAWEAVTEHYGELNDAAVARAWILQLARRAEADGHPSFTYGVLFGTQLHRTEASLADADRVLKRAFETKL